MLTKSLLVFCQIAALVLVQGCGTLVGGTKQKVAIDSEPSQATFHINPSGISGTTPATVVLKRKASYTVVVEKDGYKTKGTILEKDVAWLPIGLDAFFFWPGCFIDLGTGGAYQLKPSRLFIELEKK